MTGVHLKTHMRPQLSKRLGLWQCHGPGFFYKTAHSIWESRIPGTGAQYISTSGISPKEMVLVILPPIKLDNVKHVRDSVFDTLRGAILDGKFAPGARLIERDIAETLGISRTPVREAIRKLELEGLVTHIPRKGVVVAGFSKADVMEILAIRIVLEGLICRLAAEKIKARELERLKSIQRQMAEEIGRGNSKKINQLHDKFHDLIYQTASSPRLYALLNTLREYINKFAQVGYTQPGRTEAALLEHDGIVSALSQHDASEAEKAAKHHVEQSRQAYLDAMAF